MTRPDPVAPGPGQLSVWDFPRPPSLVQWGERVVVELAGAVIAETTAAWCVLETSHPPTYYLPADSFVAGSLRSTSGTSFCEWKGHAAYLDLVAGDQVASAAAWTYPRPTPAFAVLADHVALYPAAVDRCLVDGEPVTPQPGGFYGGWITSRVVGPFKGAPGTLGW
ncbi:MAG: DUF427 domain-containing protein [Propionibacteriales bacterium]|nr:DUF427 domain-containing protein [Propionibacteriales bacterium]